MDEVGVIRKAHILISGDNNSVMIGKRFNSGPGFRILCLEGKEVEIGNDCMFSTNCELRTSDDHSIFCGEERINPARNTLVGDNVWFGENVVCLKGAEIADGDVIGHSSICTKGIYEKNSIYVGSPARKIRNNITWEIERI